MIAILRRHREGFGSRLAALAGSAQGFLKATLQNVAREALRWVLGMSVSYLIAAGLAITALALLLSAAVEGIVALGVPSYLAPLILAVACAGLAYLFYLKGKNRKLVDETEAEDVPGLSVRIGRPRVRSEEPSRSRPRRRTFDVHRAADRGWEVSGSSHGRKGRTFGSKPKAVKAARKAAMAEGPSRVVVHRADGRIQDVSSYSHARGSRRPRRRR